MWLTGSSRLVRCLHVQPTPHTVARFQVTGQTLSLLSSLTSWSPHLLPRISRYQYGWETEVRPFATLLSWFPFYTLCSAPLCSWPHLLPLLIGTQLDAIPCLHPPDPSRTSLNITSLIFLIPTETAVFASHSHSTCLAHAFLWVPEKWLITAPLDHEFSGGKATVYSFLQRKTLSTQLHLLNDISGPIKEQTSLPDSAQVGMWNTVSSLGDTFKRFMVKLLHNPFSEGSHVKTNDINTWKAWPGKKNTQGKYWDMCHPSRSQILNSVHWSDDHLQK